MCTHCHAGGRGIVRSLTRPGYAEDRYLILFILGCHYQLLWSSSSRPFHYHHLSLITLLGTNSASPSLPNKANSRIF